MGVACGFAFCTVCLDASSSASGGEGVFFCPFFGGDSRRSPQPSPCPPASLSREDNSDKNPFSSHRKSLGAGAHRSTVGRGGAAPRSWPPLSPQEGVPVPEGRDATELSSPCPRTPAPGPRVREVWCACVRLSCKPSLPKPTPPTVCHSIQIWKQVFKKQHDARRGGGGGRAVALGPQISESLIVRTWGGGAGGRRPPLHQSAQIRAGAAQPAGREGHPGAGPGR